MLRVAWIPFVLLVSGSPMKAQTAVGTFPYPEISIFENALGMGFTPGHARASSWTVSPRLDSHAIWSESDSSRSRTTEIRHAAATGGVIGAVVGVVAGSLVATGCKTSGPSCSERSKRIGFIAGFGAIGAVVGAASGAVLRALVPVGTSP